jgi:hypothetical protein
MNKIQEERMNSFIHFVQTEYMYHYGLNRHSGGFCNMGLEEIEEGNVIFKIEFGAEEVTTHFREISEELLFSDDTNAWKFQQLD